MKMSASVVGYILDMVDAEAVVEAVVGEVVVDVGVDGIGMVDVVVGVMGSSLEWSDMVVAVGVDVEEYHKHLVQHFHFQSQLVVVVVVVVAAVVAVVMMMMVVVVVVVVVDMADIVQAFEMVEVVGNVVDDDYYVVPLVVMSLVDTHFDNVVVGVDNVDVVVDYIHYDAEVYYNYYYDNYIDVDLNDMELYHLDMIYFGTNYYYYYCFDDTFVVVDFVVDMGIDIDIVDHVVVEIVEGMVDIVVVVEVVVAHIHTFEH